MTETFTAVGPYRFVEIALPVILLSAQNLAYQVWNLEFWSLEFVWYL